MENKNKEQITSESSGLATPDCYATNVGSRTDEEIVAQTNKLARELAAFQGWSYPSDYKFDRHAIFEEYHPRARQLWEMARVAQMVLTDTDPDDAVLSLV